MVYRSPTMAKKPHTRQGGRKPDRDKPLKVLLAPTSAYAPAAQVLKGHLDDEAQMLTVSLSEYVVRIMLSMSKAERMSRARGAIAS